MTWDFAYKSNEKKNSKNKPNTRISYSNVIRFLIKSSIDIVIYALFVSTLIFYENWIIFQKIFSKKTI